jgi:hypothetical protein
MFDDGTQLLLKPGWARACLVAEDGTERSRLLSMFELSGKPECLILVQMKEYAQAEGVSAGFGVDLESASDLSHGIGVSETAECWEKFNVLPRGLT